MGVGAGGADGAIDERALVDASLSEPSESTLRKLVVVVSGACGRTWHFDEVCAVARRAGADAVEVLTPGDFFGDGREWWAPCLPSRSELEWH